MSFSSHVFDLSDGFQENNLNLGWKEERGEEKKRILILLFMRPRGTRVWVKPRNRPLSPDENAPTGAAAMRLHSPTSNLDSKLQKMVFGHKYIREDFIVMTIINIV